MKLLFFLSLNCLFLFGLGLIPAPGVLVQINKDGYLNTVHSFIDAINNISRGFSIPDPPRMKKGMLRIYLHHITIYELTLPKERTLIKIGPGNVINFRVSIDFKEILFLLFRLMEYTCADISDILSNCLKINMDILIEPRNCSRQMEVKI